MAAFFYVNFKRKISMPELPEIVIIAKQMNRKLKGKRIKNVEATQPKCLNKPLSQYRKTLPGQVLQSTIPFGKWLVLNMESGDRLLINLGMGGEILFKRAKENPASNSRFAVTFEDDTGFYVTLWWFGYFHFLRSGEAHTMTDDLGPDPLGLSLEEFKQLIQNKRGAIKSFLLNQRRIRGIGNYYIQEILFQARVHPLRTISTLNEKEVSSIYHAIVVVLRESIKLGSSSYELDFYGRKGGYSLEQMAIAYQDDAICPVCGTKPQKIKTGSNAHYICPECQKL